MMSENMKTNAAGKPVTVVVGATSKWQSDGRNTKLAHGTFLDDSDIPVGVRWGVGGAVAQKFAAEGFFTVLTTRTTSNAAGLSDAIQEQGGDCMIVATDDKGNSANISHVTYGDVWYCGGKCGCQCKLCV